ncbi:MAG: hypothetical protein AAGA58_03840 [Verrucomicrobiota bacterium]
MLIPPLRLSIATIRFVLIALSLAIFDIPSLRAEVFHGTVEVTGTNNATTALTPVALSDPGIGFSSGNFGDYAVTLPGGLGVNEGVLIAAIAELESAATFPGQPTLAATDGLFTPNEYSVSVFASVTGLNVEANADFAFAWFDHDDWLCGTMRNATNNGPASSLIASTGINLGSEFIDPAGTGGEYDLDLTALNGSSSDGILLVNGAKNEDNYALSRANNDGTFTIFCRDNFNDSFLENDPVNFVYLSKNDIGTDGLVALGRIEQDSDVQVGGGTFTTIGANGQILLQILGHSPETGTLLVSHEGGGTVNDDNLLSFEWRPDF